MTTLASSFADTARLFPGRRGYLNSATCGLPSLASLAAVDQHLAEWRQGEADLVRWDVPVSRSRELFASLVGVPVAWTSVGSQVAVTAGTVAASLAPGTRVVLVSGDFTSLTWPFLARTDLRCTSVALDDISEAAAEADWLVASTVQSSDGRVLDLGALSDVRTLLDATQSAGWLPLDASRFDVVTVGAYKWLSCPRGTAFATWSPRALAEITPAAPNWYAGRDVLKSLYLDEVDLAVTARAHDVSPAWPCWAGSTPALQLTLSIGVEAIHDHNVRLADAVRDALGLDGRGSAIVSLPVRPGDLERLAKAGVRCGARAGRLRLAFHHYNDDADVDLVLEALS